MTFNIELLKEAMSKEGLTVSAGDTMSAVDCKSYYDFAQRFFGLTRVQAAYGLAYPSLVTSAIPGHPDSEDPYVEVEALMPPVVFPPPTPKPVIPNINDMANPLGTEEIGEVAGPDEDTDTSEIQEQQEAVTE